MRNSINMSIIYYNTFMYNKYCNSKDWNPGPHWIWGACKLYETRTVGAAAAICAESRTSDIRRMLFCGAVPTVNHTAASRFTSLLAADHCCTPERSNCLPNQL